MEDLKLRGKEYKKQTEVSGQQAVKVFEKLARLIPGFQSDFCNRLEVSGKRDMSVWGRKSEAMY